MKIFRLAACLKCRGDLVHDEGDWLCLQCGVYYYTGLYGSTGIPREGGLHLSNTRKRHGNAGSANPSRRAG